MFGRNIRTKFRAFTEQAPTWPVTERANADFKDGEPVWISVYRCPTKWIPCMIKSRVTKHLYYVDRYGQTEKRHKDQIRALTTGSSSKMEDSFWDFLAVAVAEQEGFVRNNVPAAPEPADMLPDRSYPEGISRQPDYCAPYIGH